MGYYGRSAYRGDFYRGARAGDFWDDAGDVLGKAIGYIPSVVTKVATGFGDSLTRQLVPTTRSTFPPLQLQGSGPASPGPTVVIPGVGGGGVKVGRGKKGSRPIEIFGFGGGGHRRMNPTNPKALRRAMRRTSAFLGFAKKYVKLVNPKAHVEMRQKPLKHHHKK